MTDLTPTLATLVAERDYYANLSKGAHDQDYAHAAGLDQGIQALQGLLEALRELRQRVGPCGPCDCEDCGFWKELDALIAKHEGASE